MKNPYAGTTAATWAKHLMTQRGWSHQQVQAEIERLWDTKGPRYRDRLFLKAHNIITRRWIRKNANREGINAQGEKIVWWASKSGKTFSTFLTVP